MQLAYLNTTNFVQNNNNNNNNNNNKVRNINKIK